MQATSEVLKEGIKFIDREHWPDGPWGAEPDLVSEPPMLLLRQQNGAWASLIKIPDDKGEEALALKKELGSKGMFHPHQIVVIHLPQALGSNPAKIKDPGLYMGIFYGGIRPSELRYLEDLPPYMRERYLDTTDPYVSICHARMDLDRLLRLLRIHGLASRNP